MHEDFQFGLDPPLQRQTNKFQLFFKDKVQFLRTKIFLIKRHTLTPFDNSIG